MSATHAELVALASRWLQKKHPVVVTELATTGEEPDALGWHGSHTTLVECKASRADFLADRHKGFRRQPERGIGNARYFLAPRGLISEDELPPCWGLLEVEDGKVRQVRQSEYHKANREHESVILLSTLRRLGPLAPKGCSIRFYIIERKCRATVCMEVPQ